MKHKRLIFWITTLLFTTSINGQIIDKMYDYTTLRNKRIIKLHHQNKKQTKKIKERSFIGIKTNNDSLITFGRLDLILDSTLLITTLKTNNDTMLISNPQSNIENQDTLVFQSADYDTSFFIQLKNIQSIYISTNNQMIKKEIALLLLSTGIELIIIPPIVGLLVSGTLKGFISSGVIYFSASGIPITFWGYQKIKNIKQFKKYSMDDWKIGFKKKGF